MGFADENPGYRIDTEEQSIQWLEELVDGVEASRRDCDVIIPDNNEAHVRHQQRAYRTWLMRHGGALGSLMALHRSNKIGDVAYNEMRARIMATMTPTIVGGT